MEEKIATTGLTQHEFGEGRDMPQLKICAEVVLRCQERACAKSHTNAHTFVAHLAEVAVLQQAMLLLLPSATLQPSRCSQQSHVPRPPARSIIIHLVDLYLPVWTNLGRGKRGSRGRHGKGFLQEQPHATTDFKQSMWLHILKILVTRNSSSHLKLKNFACLKVLDSVPGGISRKGWGRKKGPTDAACQCPDNTELNELSL